MVGVHSCQCGPQCFRTLSGMLLPPTETPPRLPRHRTLHLSSQLSHPPSSLRTCSPQSLPREPTNTFPPPRQANGDAGAGAPQPAAPAAAACLDGRGGSPAIVCAAPVPAASGSSRRPDELDHLDALLGEDVPAQVSEQRERRLYSSRLCLDCHSPALHALAALLRLNHLHNCAAGRRRRRCTAARRRLVSGAAALPSRYTPDTCTCCCRDLPVQGG